MKKIEELSTCKKCGKEEKYYRDKDDYCATPDGWNLYSIPGSDESSLFLCPSCISDYDICERCSKVIKKSLIGVYPLFDIGRDEWVNDTCHTSLLCKACYREIS